MIMILETSSSALGPITVVKSQPDIDAWEWTYRVLSGDQILHQAMTRREALAWVSGHQTWSESRRSAVHSRCTMCQTPIVSREDVQWRDESTGALHFCPWHKEG